MNMNKDTLTELLTNIDKINEFSIDFVRPSIKFLIRLAVRHHLELQSSYSLTQDNCLELQNVITSLYSIFLENRNSIQLNQQNGYILETRVNLIKLNLVVFKQLFK